MRSGGRIHSGERDTIELRIPAQPENLALARLALAGVGAVAGAREDVIADLKVAVTEACTNAIQHAYPGRSRLDRDPLPRRSAGRSSSRSKTTAPDSTRPIPARVRARATAGRGWA